MSDHLQQVQAIICRVGKLGEINAADDFYEAGLSSVNALELLLELEDAFGISIPDEEFIASRTPLALSTVIARLRQLQVV
jgi:acyl carrier protein